MVTVVAAWEWEVDLFCFRDGMLLPRRWVVVSLSLALCHGLDGVFFFWFYKPGRDGFFSDDGWSSFFYVHRLAKLIWGE